MVKKAKPDPEIYQKASESLGIPPEYCMAFEDAPGGILSAHQAGHEGDHGAGSCTADGGDTETYVSGLRFVGRCNRNIKLSYWDGEKEWYLSRWLVLYRCALEKVF